MGCADLYTPRADEGLFNARTRAFNHLLEGVEGTITNTDQMTAAVRDSARSR